MYDWLLGDDLGGPDLVSDLSDGDLSGKRLRDAIVEALGAPDRGKRNGEPAGDREAAAVALLALCASGGESLTSGREEIAELVHAAGRWPPAERQHARERALATLGALETPGNDLLETFAEEGEGMLGELRAELAAARDELERWGSRRRRVGKPVAREPFPIDIREGLIIRADYENHSRTFLHVLSTSEHGFVCSVYPAGPDPQKVPPERLAGMERWRAYVETRTSITDSYGLVRFASVGEMPSPFPEGAGAVRYPSRNREMVRFAGERFELWEFEARYPGVDPSGLPWTGTKESFSSLLDRGGRFAHTDSAVQEQFVVAVRGEAHAGEIQADTMATQILQSAGGGCFAWIAERPEGLRLLVPWIRDPSWPRPEGIVQDKRDAVIAFIEERDGEIIAEEALEPAPAPN